MHIGLCSPSWPPAGAANGIVSYVSVVRDQFLADGHDVTVISLGKLHLRDGGVVDLDPLDQSTFGRLRARLGRKIDHWNGSLPFVARTIAAQVRRAHAISPLDVLEMEESFGWTGHVARAGHVPVVTRLHGPYFLRPARSRSAREGKMDDQRSAAEARAIRLAPSLTAPTNAVMRATCHHSRRNPSSLSAVIPNPIDLASPPMRWSLQACDPQHILMVGRFDFWKGADVMLAAFERLVQRRPAVRLTLVGPDEGLQDGQGQKLAFADYASLNLSPEAQQRISFRGILAPQEIAALRKQALLTLIPSRWENFPYVLLEALAVGSPVISSDWKGSEEIIEHGRTGLLTPVGNAGALADAIESMMAAPEAAARMGEAGLRSCATHYSRQAVCARLLDHYQHTIESFHR